MAITDKEQGVWELDEVYNKINQGDIWEYTENYDMWAWGHNEYRLGGAGSPQNQDKSSPTQIGAAISTGWDLSKTHSNGDVSQRQMAVIENGNLWVWGYNIGGPLGLNNQTSYNSPIQVGTDSTWAAVATGGTTMIATKTDGTLWGWGTQGFGALGLNSRTPYSSPVQLMSDKTWPTSSDALTVGGSDTGKESRMFAIASDGTIWACGQNSHGSLGTNVGGTSNHKSSPVQIPGSWKMTTSADRFGAGIKTDGTLWSWGYSYSGSIGVPGFARSSPVQLNGTNWATISSNWKCSLGTQTNGTLWSWGEGGYGTMGDNSKGDNLSPTQIGTNTNWSYTARPQNTYLSAAALKTDGTLWAWGSNRYGQMGNNEGTGDNSTGGLSSPLQIPGTQWSQIKSAGRKSFIATSIQ